MTEGRTNKRTDKMTDNPNPIYPPPPFFKAGAIIKGHNSCTNFGIMMCNNPNLDLVNIKAYTKFGEILLICSQDIKRKPNFGVNQGP